MFSFSRPQAEWFAWEWASDVLFSLAHRAAGLKGVVLLAGVAIAQQPAAPPAATAAVPAASSAPAASAPAASSVAAAAAARPADGGP